MDPEKPRPTRRWIKWLGAALILVVWSPLLAFLGGMVLVSFEVHRARVAAEQARAAVRIGATLSDVVVSSSENVGTERFLQCYEATCLGPPELVLASRRSNRFRVLPEGGSAPFGDVEEWRRQLLRLDRVGCNRAKITFCGRPWITFLVELDGSQRVSTIGPLSVTAD